MLSARLRKFRKKKRVSPIDPYQKSTNCMTGTFQPKTIALLSMSNLNNTSFSRESCPPLVKQPVHVRARIDIVLKSSLNV